MKNSILALSLTAILFSCKKDKTTDFTATDVTGTSIVKGNVNKNVITPNGSGGWSNTTRVPAANVNVTIKVNKSALYPNSSSQGADVYSGTTDNNGNYSITVKTNATGVPALITIDGFTATQDTVINGSTKTGLYASYAGTSQTRTLFMGQNSQFDYGFTATNVSSNPNNIVVGSAVITGSVGMSYMKEVASGTLITLTTVTMPVPAGRIVYLNFSNDPTLLATKTYTAATDASGYYSFNVATVAAGTPGFVQNASIWAPDFATTRDTVKIGGTIATGRAGVFQMVTTNQNGVFNNAIRNATHMTYNTFVVN